MPDVERGSIAAMREIKPDEQRASLSPANVARLCEAGLTVYLGDGFGEGISVGNEEYIDAGAVMLPNEVDRLWGGPAALLVGVKEPVGPQVEWLRENQGSLAKKTLFTYLHLAHPSEREIAEALMESEITAIAYETVSKQREDGRFDHPLLKPMSIIAGVMAVDYGSYFLSTVHGGRGVLLGESYGVDTKDPGKVVIIGGGAAGTAAARRALCMGADVFVIEKNAIRRRELKDNDALRGIYVVESTSATIAKHVVDADLLIGAVYISGEAPPNLIPFELQEKMKKGAVILSIDCDQGSVVEGIRLTTHTDPSCVTEYGHVTIAIPNMPSAYAQTATELLSNATFPYVRALAERGIQALGDDLVLMRGLNVHRGRVTNEGVAKAHGFEYTSPEEALRVK